MRNLLIIVRTFKGVIVRLEPVISLFVSFLIVTAGVLGYSLLRAEK